MFSVSHLVTCKGGFTMKATILIWILSGSIFLFSCKKNDDGIIPDESHGAETSKGIIYDSFNNKNLVVYSNEEFGIITAFERPQDGDSLRDFTLLDELPFIIADEFGNRYDVFGNVGNVDSLNLNKVDGFFGFWFSFATFYPFPSLISDEGETTKLPRDRFDAWNIDEEFVSRGAPTGAIPAITQPKFKLIDDSDRFLNGTNDPANVFPSKERVLIFKSGDDYLAFPHAILNWHEIVFEDEYMVNYCPLTGTGFAIESNGGAWNVSGLLYNNNLIISDGETDSKWSQIYLECVNGERRDETFEKIPSQEMTWDAVLQFAKRRNVLYLTTDTGFNRDYALYPYGSYRQNQDAFLFDNKYLDSRVPNKEVVYGILIDSEARVYRFSDFN